MSPRRALTAPTLVTPSLQAARTEIPSRKPPYRRRSADDRAAHRNLSVTLMQGTVQWDYVISYALALCSFRASSQLIGRAARENNWRTCSRGDSVGVYWEFSASSIRSLPACEEGHGWPGV
ncbi:hypothetical protein B0H13DRAFT_2307971 [Mycena leptocephala]|nr:hypothetical protein B0H13DRAFT_2307971 [Mycena leptocephala]